MTSVPVADVVVEAKVLAAMVSLEPVAAVMAPVRARGGADSTGCRRSDSRRLALSSVGMVIVRTFPGRGGYAAKSARVLAEGRRGGAARGVGEGDPDPAAVRGDRDRDRSHRHASRQLRSRRTERRWRGGRAADRHGARGPNQRCWRTPPARRPSREAKRQARHWCRGLALSSQDSSEFLPLGIHGLLREPGLSAPGCGSVLGLLSSCRPIRLSSVPLPCARPGTAWRALPASQLRRCGGRRF